MPPPFEICSLAPGPGNAWTYTSGLPDSSEEYAIQRPSGENFGDPSPNRDCATGSARPPPSSGNTHASSVVSAFFASNARNLPSGENDTGLSRVPDGSRRVALALRSAGISHMVMPPMSHDRNARRFPSGDQTGS